MLRREKSYKVLPGKRVIIHHYFLIKTQVTISEGQLNNFKFFFSLRKSWTKLCLRVLLIPFSCVLVVTLATITVFRENALP